MAYFRVNQTAKGETLYYLKDVSTLFIIKPDEVSGKVRIQYTITGEASHYLYDTLSVSTEKKKLFSNVKDFNKIFYANLSAHIDDVLQKVAEYESKYLDIC